MPDDLTLEDCAKGVIVEFEYNNSSYKVDTSAGDGFRTRSLDFYYLNLEKKVLNIINKEDLNVK